MKRRLAIAALIFSLSGAAIAQEPTEPKAAAKTEEGTPEMPGWLWANFVILVIGLGYLTAKTAPAIFRSREQEIRQGIDEAAAQKKDAETRAADIDRRLAGLATEIAKLREGISAEMSAESDRLRQETERLVRRIEEQAQQEIGFLSKAASQQLKTYSADLALDLAAQRIRHRMNRDTQHELVGDFVAGLRQA